MYPKNQQFEPACLGRRIVALVADILIISAISPVIAFVFHEVLSTLLPFPAEAVDTLAAFAAVFIVLAYFVLLTSCSRSATLGMQTQKLRVTLCNGESMERWRALLRALLKCASVYAVVVFIRLFHALLPYQSHQYVIAICGAILLGFPLLHPNNKALHDCLLGTMVTKTLNPLSANVITDWWRAFSFRFRSSVVDVLVLTVFFLMLHVITGDLNNRELAGRVQYALSQSVDLQQAVEDFYTANGIFPEANEAGNLASAITFPDGGGSRIESQGRIKIWFDVIPALKESQLWLTPSVKERKIIWRCQTTGKPLPRLVGSWSCKD